MYLCIYLAIIYSCTWYYIFIYLYLLTFYIFICLEVYISLFFCSFVCFRQLPNGQPTDERNGQADLRFGPAWRQRLGK